MELHLPQQIFQPSTNLRLLSLSTLRTHHLRCRCSWSSTLHASHATSHTHTHISISRLSTCRRPRPPNPRTRLLLRHSCQIRPGRGGISFLDTCAGGGCGP